MRIGWSPNLHKINDGRRPVADNQEPSPRRCAPWWAVDEVMGKHCYPQPQAADQVHCKNRRYDTEPSCVRLEEETEFVTMGDCEDVHGDTRDEQRHG